MSELPYSDAALAESAAVFAERITPAKARWQYCFNRTAYEARHRRTGEATVYLNERTFPVVDRITGCVRGGAKYRLGKIKRFGVDGAIEWDAEYKHIVTKPLLYVGPMQAWNVGHLYFARCASHPHVVKIGFSRRVRERLDDIESKAKTKIKLRHGEIRVGTLADEHWWHKNWEKYRIAGEWFFDPHTTERSLPAFLAETVEAVAAWSLIAITSDRARTTRTDILARSSVQRRQTHSYEHKERSLSGLAIFPASDFVLVRTAGVTGPFETETRKTPKAPKARLSVPYSQSAAVTSGSVIPAVTSLGWLIAGARCVLARHRPFQFVRAVSVARHLSALVKFCQEPASGLSDGFKGLSLSRFHALETSEGLIHERGKIGQELGKFSHAGL